MKSCRDAQTLGRELTAADGPEQREVAGVPEAQGAEAMAVIDDWACDGVEGPRAGSRVVDHGESIEVALVGPLRHLCAAVQIGDPLAQGLPGDLPLCRASAEDVDTPSSAAMERHLAANGLPGGRELYSETDVST